MVANWLEPGRRELLARLTEQRGAATRRSRIPVRPTADAPASSTQRQLWFLQQLIGDNPLYHMAAAVKLRGPLDRAALSSALGGLVRRHQALRTTFFAGPGGAPWQRVREPGAVDLEPASDEDEAGFVRRRFDLTDGPLIRFRLVREDDEQHRLTVVVHHIVADGWSVDLLVEQLMADYAATIEGRPSGPAPEVQFADYAAWEADEAADRLGPELDYWERQLAGAEPPGLPSDHADPARPTFAGALHELRLPPATAERLRLVAAEHRTSLFVVGLSALGVLLSRWSRQTDVLLGSPFAGRAHPELCRTVGCFVTTLPLRLRIQPVDAFGDVVDRVREAVLAAQTHENVAFDALVDRLSPGRVPGGRGTLVRHLFRYDEHPSRTMRAGPLTATLIPLHTGTAKFDLTVALTGAGDGSLGCSIEYSTELFAAATVRRFADGLGAMLAAAGSAVRVAALPVQAAADRAEVLRFGDGGPAADRSTLPALIERGLDRWPHRVVAAGEDGELRGADLERCANRLAHRLRALGVSTGTPVGVLLPRSVRLVVALVAVLKAGGVLVPLDPEHPPARQASILGDVAARVLVTDDAGARPAAEPPAGLTILDLDAEEDLIAALPSDRITSSAIPEGPAYILHTSGSTGRPKGAINPHWAVVNRLSWMQDALGLEPGESVLQKTPVGFDVSVWELFWPLVAGGRCVLAAPGAHRDPYALAETIRRHGIGTVHFVPSMLDAFLTAGVARSCRAVLRRVVCSGEVLSPGLLARAQAELPDSRVYNLYGPTEAAVDVSWHECAPMDTDGRVPIGRPIAGSRLYVLDHAGTPAPIGVPGELWIGGTACGTGYHGQPGLTAERFVADPFEPAHTGARLYRTGDIVRWRPDGILDYLRRDDRQLKIRGVRVEPGEIEHALGLLDGVAGAAVAVRESPGGDRRLIAWYRPAGPAAELERLRRELRDILPAALVPGALVPVEHWPVGPNGKLDRSRLPEPEVTEHPGRVVARDDVERALAAIWAEFLEGGEPGIEEDFFALGGHSLQAVMILARIQETFGVEIALGSVLFRPTVAAVAEQIREALRRRPERAR